MGKKEDKQFPLTNKKNCAVYLNRIISSCERCMDRLKKYNVEGNKLLVEYMGKDVVPHEVYVELLDKTSSVPKDWILRLRAAHFDEKNTNYRLYLDCKRWELFPFIHILKCTNAKIEFIDQFSEHFAWNSIISNADYDIDNFFVAQIRFECTDFDKLKKILNVMPQSVEKYFELSKNYIVLPNEGFEEEENSIYTIKFSVHPASIGSKIQFRKMMNQYLREIYKALENVQID